MEERYKKDYYKRTNEGGFDATDFNKIIETESHTTLLQLINNWLERLPFFESEFWGDYKNQFNLNEQLHPFWSDYRNIYKEGLTKREAGKINDFDFIFFEQEKAANPDREASIKTKLSPRAMRAALFIMLYRDFPVFQTSYQILDSLVEVDHQMAT